ncbi:formate/nitrite transporter family protein [Curtanaerobium respiraculi]|uniref:formate/nitrite transporter family protein n=1 Tax=Curtanaerobium respiraculi TaxID=2949669 RepID=UPI0024B34EC4|nr:formate/nitrite transporter family protein [Curtanaerobium respiraculi]
MEHITKEDILSTKPDCISAAALEAKAETVGTGKANLELGRTVVLAIMAGIQIGMGALFMTYVKADQTLGFAAANVLGGLCFALGLICVIVAGSELFTGNVLLVMAAGSRKIRWSAVAKNWAVVWLGNFIGSLILVGIIFGCGLMGTKAGDNTIGAQMVAVAAGKINLGPDQIFFRGIMCNLLVCLAVWMGFAGRTVIDKIFTAIFPVMAFVAMGFEHCVANMFFLPMGVIASSFGYGAAPLSWSGVIYNISLATVGNIVGGAIFVGLIYWLGYRRKEAAA